MYHDFWKHPYILPESSIASENGWLEDWFPFGFRPIFRGYASFTEGKILSPKRKPIKTCIDLNLSLNEESCLSSHIKSITKKSHIQPGRLTWNIIIEVWKVIFLSQWVICMFHVNLPGCTPNITNTTLVKGNPSPQTASRHAISARDWEAIPEPTFSEPLIT